MAEHPALLHLVQAARVLDGVLAEPTPEGVLLPGTAPEGAGGSPVVPWAQIDRLLRGDDPTGPAPRLRLALALQLHAAVRALGTGAADAVARAARPLALPGDHPLHPGPEWVREAVPGGVLAVGLGVARLLPGQDGALPLPPDVAAAAGLDVEGLWPRLDTLAERLSSFALDRLHSGGHAALAGVGGCDALTLLTLPAVRERLTGHGARREPVSAPRRDRVWIGPAAADPDYVRAVWLLTAPAARGVLGPMALTATGVAPAGTAGPAG